MCCCRPQPAEDIYSWVVRHLPDRPHPPFKRPINWIRWISALVLLSGAITASYTAWPYVLPVIQSRTVWAAVTLISILLFTSGHMFNQIRNVPYVAGDGRGGITYFAPGFQNQYGLETQIVAAMCKEKQDPLPASLYDRACPSDRCRRCSRAFGHLPGHQGPAHERSQDAGRGSVRLGRRPVPHVQPPPQHLPGQEPRLPLFAATLYVGEDAACSAMPLPVCQATGRRGDIQVLFSSSCRSRFIAAYEKGGKCKCCFG